MAYISFQPKDYFNCTIYTGNNSTNAQTGVGFQPDLIWFKRRDSGAQHSLFDAVRGVTKGLASDTNAAESTISDALTSFDSDGFTLGADSGNYINLNSATYASWNWKAGTTSGLSGGTITPTSYSINASAGMGIYQTTGTGSAGTIAHGLGKVPKMIISKRTGNTGSWVVYHDAMGNANEMYLDATDGQSSASATWNSTTPTSTVWSVGNDQNNTSGYTIISYVFAPVKGFSHIGTYDGNGNANGAFCYTGFKPSWLMVKSTAAGQQWLIMDNKRGYNGSNELLYADSNEAAGSAEVVDLLSNGFKMRSTGAGNNSNGQKYIYMAFAAEPFVASNGDPATAR